MVPLKSLKGKKVWILKQEKKIRKQSPLASLQLDCVSIRVNFWDCGIAQTVASIASKDSVRAVTKLFKMKVQGETPTLYVEYT